MAQRSKTIHLEEKILVFEFGITQVQFNKLGKYVLKLSLRHGHRADLLSEVTLDVNDTGSPQLRYEVETDALKWDGLVSSSNFKNNQFKFMLPKGFCKNDKNYDVHLLIEAYNTASKGRERSGEATFAIYPRTELPKANLNVQKGTDYYKYAGVLTLLRPLTRASISMHCGRLSYTVAFREHLDSLLRSTSLESLIAETVVESEGKSPPPIPRLKISGPVEEEKPPALSELTYRKTVTSTTSVDESTIKNKTKEQYPAGHASVQQQKSPQPALNTADQTMVSDMSSKAVASYEPLMSEDSFHISMSSSPPPDDLNLPSNRETTMDTPARGTSPDKAGRSSPKKQPARSTVKSPTMTSPRPADNHGPINRHVAKPGHEQIYVIVHGATSLPSRSDGADPLPFATLKSTHEEKGGRAAQCATHATLQPTHSPTWEEVLTMEVSEDRVEEEELILTVSDSSSKEKLVKFQMPISSLAPFHPYHFELVQPTKSIPSGIRLYATILRKLSYLPRLQGFGFCGLEVTLRGFEQNIKNHQGPLLAVARIVPDYTKYKESMLSRKPCPAGITTTTVTFPSPNPSAFEVMKQHKQGFPQLTTPSTGGTKPEWNHVFMFCNNDTATMFGHNSALVLEFYPTSTTMTSVTWTIRSPIGFSTLLLDEDLFQALTSDAGRLGVRVDDLIVQGSNFQTLEGPYPSCRLLVRLINTERPDTLAVSADANNLPQLDGIIMSNGPYQPQDPNKDVAERYLQSTPETKPQKQPGQVARDTTAVGGPPFERKKTRLLVKEDEYPPDDALETILPDYVLTENDQDLTGTNPASTSKLPSNARNQEMEKTVDTHTRSLLDHQAKELNKYREAVKRMSNDIVKLRENLSQLQEENALLRRELMLNKEIGSSVMNDIHQGVVSSQEVADKFVAVRQKLTKDGEELKKYKSKVQHLQNQMIKANEREKEYLMNKPSQKELEETVKHLQEKQKKMKKVEETCVQQEKVIQKMEKLLNKYMKNSAPVTTIAGSHTVPIGGDRAEQNATTLLTEENRRLQDELDRMRMQQQQYDNDKADLLARLDRAESRVVSLESQLDHNSRAWAKERHELTVRLQEHRNGIVRTTAPNTGIDPILD